MGLALIGVLVGAVVALLLAWAWNKERRIRRQFAHMPGVPQLPFIGCMLELLRNLDRQPRWWLEKTQQMGLIWYGWTLGQPPLVFVIDPVCVEHILKTNFANYPKGENFYTRMKDLLGQGIFNADGTLWKTQRQVASHMFKASIMKGVMMETFEHHGKLVLKKLESFCDSPGRYVDVQDLFFRFTLDSIGVIAFGKNINSLERDVPFSTAFDLAQVEIERRFFAPHWRFRNESQLRKSIAVLDEFAAQVIAERRKDPELEQKQDLLSRYMVARDENGEPYSDSYLRDTIMNFMIAGRDTTAQTLTWCTYLLAAHPDKEAKLIEEINTTLKTSPQGGLVIPSYDQLKTMKYIEAVISEALRLFPPVYGDPKEAQEDDVLPNGVLIPKGSIVGWSAYVMGRLPQFWDEADKFLPERWVNNDPKKYHPYQFIPFQAGPRTCLGQRMAYQEAGLLLVMMYQSFYFRLKPGHVVDFQRSITLPAKGGMWVSIHRRT